MSKAGLRPFVRGAYKQTIKPQRITRRDKGKNGDKGAYSDGLPTQILKIWRPGETSVLFLWIEEQDLPSKMFWAPGGKIIGLILNKSPLGK